MDENAPRRKVAAQDIFVGLVDIYREDKAQDDLHLSRHITQKWRRHYVKTTSFWRNNVKMTSFWSYNDVIITPCEVITTFWSYNDVIITSMGYYWPFVIIFDKRYHSCKFKIMFGLALHYQQPQIWYD